MPKGCKEGDILMQDKTGQASYICPGIAVMGKAVEAHFSQLGKDIKDTVEEAFQTQLEQATGFAWEERKMLKCILGWAKRAKDADNRVNAWMWSVGSSIVTGIIVGLIMFFMKGGTP